MVNITTLLDERSRTGVSPYAMRVCGRCTMLVGHSVQEDRRCGSCQSVISVDGVTVCRDCKPQCRMCKIPLCTVCSVDCGKYCTSRSAPQSGYGCCSNCADVPMTCFTCEKFICGRCCVFNMPFPVVFKGSEARHLCAACALARIARYGSGVAAGITAWMQPGVGGILSTGAGTVVPI